MTLQDIFNRNNEITKENNRYLLKVTKLEEKDSKSKKEIDKLREEVDTHKI